MEHDFEVEVEARRASIRAQISRVTSERSDLRSQRRRVNNRLETARRAIQRIRRLITEARRARNSLENLDCTDTRRWRGVHQRRVARDYRRCQTNGDRYNRGLNQIQSDLIALERRLSQEVGSLDRSIGRMTGRIADLNHELNSLFG